MKRQIQAFLLSESAGLGVIAPGGEIGAGIGELLAKQHGHRSNALSQFHRSDLVGRIHAVAPAAEPHISET
jgi:hypothetical protein